MKRFLRSNLILTLVALVLMAGAIAIPLSGSITHSHAAGPNGEQPLSIRPQAVQQSTPGTPITIDTSCPAKTPISLPPFNAGDTVGGNVILTTTDTVANEINENEVLVLSDTAGVASFPPFVPTTQPTPQPFTFTPTANDTLQGCIQFHDGDETGTVTITPPTLFILAQGINTSLSQGEINNNQIANGFLPIASSLENQFPGAHFISYSYNGVKNNGALQTYQCQNTFLNPLKDDTLKLRDEITSYLNQPNHQNSNIYLIGHSLGGVVDLGYLAFLESKGWPALPNGGKIKGVITLDSPIGGVVHTLGYRTYIKLVAAATCDPLLGIPFRKFASVDDLMKIFDTAQSSTPIGGKANLAKVLFGNNTPNQQLADDAKTHGIPILTVGNLHDFLWDTMACGGIFPRVNFLSTQWLNDEGANSTIYGRDFKADASGSPNCTPSTVVLDKLNHLIVLTDSQVQQGIMEFLPNGGTPTSLAVAPANPPSL